jgi:hypothetical protein
MPATIAAALLPKPPAMGIFVLDGEAHIGQVHAFSNCRVFHRAQDKVFLWGGR